MEEREKIDISNYENYVLRIDNEAFVVTGLNEKLNKFLDDGQREFYHHVRSNLHINLEARDQEIDKFYEEWCQEGIEASVIKPSGKWQKGIVRFSMKAEFFPDEPEEEKVEENGHQEVENITESPLDEIRQQLTEENKS
ncbi:MAG: KGK domain-containing protein [Microcoleaceae cyanobacterium]